MRRRLETDLCEVRDRIAATLRHLLDLIKDQAVIVSCERRRRCEPKNRKKNPSRQSLHGGISNHQKPIWQWGDADNPVCAVRIAGRIACVTLLCYTDSMLRFTKMDGAGNDFILIDNRAGDTHLNRSQIARLCDRHRGIGADGVLLLENPSDHADFRMRYFNADGGEAEMCGNGARCFARFANKLAGADEKISFETPAGVISAELAGDLVTLQMTEPTDLRLSIHLRIGAEKGIVHFINSGVPHVVVPVAQVGNVDVTRY